MFIMRKLGEDYSKNEVAPLTCATTAAINPHSYVARFSGDTKISTKCQYLMVLRCFEQDFVNAGYGACHRIEVDILYPRTLKT